MTGWICPRCSASNAPGVNQCPCSAQHAAPQPTPIGWPGIGFPNPAPVPVGPGIGVPWVVYDTTPSLPPGIAYSPPVQPMVGTVTVSGPTIFSSHRCTQTPCPVCGEVRS